MSMDAQGGKKPSVVRHDDTTTEITQLWEQIRQKDAQLVVLQKRLAHFRSWVTSIHAKVQQVNPQAIKNAKRLYVGNLPTDTTEDGLKHFLYQLMMRTGAHVSPGQAILSCKITQDKNYAFVELRSVEETSNCLAFDGVACRDTHLKIRRPSNYDAATALMLGPTAPDPTLDTSQLDICRTLVEDSPNKLFVGGLSCEWTDDQVKELLLPYGQLKSFNLVMDKATGKSKGYAFCEYLDEGLVEYVIQSLHSKRVGNKSLTVKRALEGSKSGPGPTALTPTSSSSAAALAALLGVSVSGISTSGSGPATSSMSGSASMTMPPSPGSMPAGFQGSPTPVPVGTGLFLPSATATQAQQLQLQSMVTRLARADISSPPSGGSNVAQEGEQDPEQAPGHPGYSSSGMGGLW